MAGVATEKPGSHLCAEASLIGLEIKPQLFIYMFSETQRGYREAGVSDGSFKKKTLLTLEFLFDLITFSVWLGAPECRTEKLWSSPEVLLTNG